MKPTINEMHLSNTNRIFYINEDGGLFVQFRPNKRRELEMLRSRLNLGETVYYVETLPAGNTIEGYVSRVTNSGVALKDWSIK